MSRKRITFPANLTVPAADVVLETVTHAAERGACGSIEEMVLAHEVHRLREIEEAMTRCGVTTRPCATCDVLIVVAGAIDYHTLCKPCADECGANDDE